MRPDFHNNIFSIKPFCNIRLIRDMFKVIKSKNRSYLVSISMMYDYCSYRCIRNFNSNINSLSGIFRVTHILRYVKLLKEKYGEKVAVVMDNASYHTVMVSKILKNQSYFLD